MKRMNHLMFVVIVLIALAAGACRNSETNTSGDATETIAPAAPQPEATGTEAMTQTVSIEGDQRSDAEGGVLTAPGGLVPDATTSTVGTAGATAATATGTAAPPTATTTR